AREHAAQLTKSMATAGESSPAEIKAMIAKIKPELERYGSTSAELVQLALSDFPRAQEKVPAFVALFEKLETEMEQISDRIEKAVELSQREGDQVVDVAKLIIVLVCLFAAVALIAISVMLARGILLPLDRALEAANAVAAGDLTVTIDVKGQDEVGQLLAALSKMKDDLADSVSSIQLAADNVNTGSKEIARGNADLSSRTEEQASSLEETASSMEELTTTVKQNAENARQASQLAVGASDVATKGGDAVRNVVTTMSGISDASRKIADIISVIDGIAFQTNILALNAAVEAARAGEQGRGFAVVASEVRALAQRSAAAAKEIKSLIEDSVGRVNEGSKQVDGAGKTMEEIVNSVKRVADIVSEISAASQEQMRGIDQVSQAVMQMDQVVQQNAALVEESAAAAENLSSQAEVMAETASRFKLDDSRRRIQAAPRVEQASVHAQLRAPRATANQPDLPKLRAVRKARAAKANGDAQPKDSGEDWKEF
ncbi:MAG: methyl-accepting chemotaxis protein, partial [Betaproteobacteria bacterium]|nr:methyl-accepting chemotaxis protein [Betaproteobacteria bacterium]